jgi:hypothetical protein
MPSISRISVACLSASLACAGGPNPGGLAPGSSTDGRADGGTASVSPDGGTAPAPVTAPVTAPAPAPGWVLARSEDFESVALGSPLWQPDPVPDDGPFADHGAFFRNLGVVPPPAFRLSAPFGQEGWLTVESYTRSAGAPFASFASVVPDPANPRNHVLRIASPAHTDATVVRPTVPLPPRYRVSLRVGFPSFGDGLPGLNGYRGGETAEPFSSDDATRQNGFYWLTILDAPPRPHNNTWIHHHRKVVIDSDNHFPAWMEIYDGRQFTPSGEHPVMMFALDGKGQGTERTGKPFLSFAGGAWQPSGMVRAADAYLPGEWYSVSIERSEGRFTLEISGRFRYGGQTTYRSSIDYAANCVWHFNQSPAEDASRCIDPGYYPSIGPSFPNWPAATTWPDYFMFGDPHTNYYTGEVYYDDVRLEVWR